MKENQQLSQNVNSCCYQMPLLLFLVIDNNTKLQLVAQALVSDETVESCK